MFELLTKVLLLVLFGLIAWYILLRFIPKQLYTWLGAAVLVAFLILAFLQPADGTIATVWSIFSLPFRPLGLVIILLISALRDWKKKVPANQVIAALAILIITSVPAITYALTEQLERDVTGLLSATAAAETANQRAGVIVVLAQGTTQANVPPRTLVQVTGRGSRLLYAAQLYREQVDAGNTPLVIVSAANRLDLQGGTEEQRSEARDAQVILNRLGVPNESIVLDTGGVDLRSSARGVKKILEDRKLEKRVFLVTSALEIRRARLAFQRSDIDIRVIPRPADFLTIQGRDNTPKRNFQITDLLPSADALATTTRVIDEYLVSIYYFLRGWLAPISL